MKTNGLHCEVELQGLFATLYLHMQLQEPRPPRSRTQTLYIVTVVENIESHAQCQIVVFMPLQKFPCGH